MRRQEIFSKNKKILPLLFFILIPVGINAANDLKLIKKRL